MQMLRINMVKKYTKALRLFNKKIEEEYGVDVSSVLKENKENINKLNKMREDAINFTNELLTEYKQTAEVVSLIDRNRKYESSIESMILDCCSKEDRLLVLEEKINKHAKKINRMYFRERNVTAELMLGFYIHYELGITKGTVEYDSRVFQTPYGKRRLDAYCIPHSIALESKLGYACLSKRIREEILKDKYLVENGIIKRCIWVLYSSASKTLVRALISANLEVSIGWNDHEIDRIKKLGYIPTEYFS